MWSLRIPKKHTKFLVWGVVLFFILMLALGIWGIARQAEVIQLRQQVQLQNEQLKLLNQKAETINKKIETLDALDQELRQMVKGSERGSEPKGGPTISEGESSAKTPSGEKVGEGARVSPALLSARFSILDGKAQKRLTSFYTLRQVLRSGTGDQIKLLNSVLYGNQDSGQSTIPSIWPTKGVITSSFGSRVDPVYGGTGRHEGVDIANDYGTPIVATANGVVRYAGYDGGGYGNMVEIDHGNGFVTIYGHCSAILVSAGMTVVQGQTIALMGSTGKSTGNHAHYEIRINGTAVDPMLFLPIQ